MPNKCDLTVGDLAIRSGVSVSTLHFYEREGLIKGWRTTGNQRRFDRGTLRLVGIIRVAQRAGIALAAIKETLATVPEGRTPTAADWRRFTASWRATLDVRIEALTQLRDQIDSCIGCGCLSLEECPLRNRDDRLAAEGAGPRLLRTRLEKRRRLNRSSTDPRSETMAG